MRDFLGIGLRFPDQRLEPRLQILDRCAVEAVVDLARIDQLFALASAEIDAIPFLAVERVPGVFEQRSLTVRGIVMSGNDSKQLYNLITAAYQGDVKTAIARLNQAMLTPPERDPFLRFITDVFCPAGRPTVREAIFLAAWTVQHVIDVNPGGVAGPARIATLERDGAGVLTARSLPTEEIDEHLQAIESAATALRKWRDEIQSGSAAVDAPEPPTPPQPEPPKSKFGERMRRSK